MDVEANQDPQALLILTDHARSRMAQRNVSGNEVSYIMTYGQEVHRAGAILVTLRQQYIPKEVRHNADISRLEGITVVLSCDESTVLSVWRNRHHGTKRIRRKPIFCWKAGR